MNEEVRNLAPTSLWKNFVNLNAIPRASKKEERVIQFMLDYGKKLGLETVKDHIGNVIIKKPASAGMEDRQTIVMQSHLDMVHQKNSDTNFNFDTEGIKMLVDGDWVKAEGTTLGADNGIGVAAIMAILESDDITHPPIEALFTIDEETGMTGALELQGDVLSGSILLNLDTEDDDELTIGCAGGIDVSGEGSYLQEETGAGVSSFELHVKGLTGGHSGADIHLGRANSNKVMNRILFEFNKEFDIRISEIDGGGLRNAIPRESRAVFVVNNDSVDSLKQKLNELSANINAEFKTTDPDIQIDLNASDSPERVLNQSFQNKLLSGLYAICSGIYRMSPDIPDLVQTSNNLARVLVQDGAYTILCLTRSAVDSEKVDLANALSASLQLIGAEVKYGGSYPGWAPKPEAAIVKLMTELYKEKFNENPHVNAIHAGLECGIIGQHYPDMDMISFGPNIRGAHSPDEKAQISSVLKFWGYLLDTLKEIPKKQN